MADHLLLMHGDVTTCTTPAMWQDYFHILNARDAFMGGSAIGAGETFRKEDTPCPVTSDIGGYVRIRAKDMAEARELLSGCPVFECGGTVEIRELPRD